MADATGNGARKPRILLVEDNPGDVDLIRRRSRARGWTVFSPY